MSKLNVKTAKATAELYGLIFIRVLQA